MGSNGDAYMPWALNARSRYLLGWIGGDEILVVKETSKFQVTTLNQNQKSTAGYRAAVIIPSSDTQQISGSSSEQPTIYRHDTGRTEDCRW
jgi:hypothetical protein